MKAKICFAHFAAAVMIALLFGGCLSRPPTVNVQHFVLACACTNEPAPSAAGQLSVGIGFVKMPPYLLRKSMAVRNGANEIEYIEHAAWAERLDYSFQRTLAANLSHLLPSENVYLNDWNRDQVKVRISIEIQQFDVDTTGRGNLNAQWRITAPDSDQPLKVGHARLSRTDSSGRGDPQIIATTLSELTAEFSRELAQSIRESVKPTQ